MGVVAALLLLSTSAMAQPQPDPGGDPVPKPTSLPSAPQDAKPADMSGVTPPALPAGLRAAYDRVRANVQKQSAKPGNTYSFGTTLDQTTGKIVVDTDAPAAVVDQIIAAPPGLSATDRQAHQNIVVHAGKVGLESGRREDTPPYYGGAGSSPMPVTVPRAMPSGMQRATCLWSPRGIAR